MAQKYDPELKAQARGMRRSGMSVPQIAARLDGLPISTVQAWVRDIPPAPWTRRANSKDELRERARELRLKGMTYDQIARELHVSKGSLSLWLRDLPTPPRSPESLAASRRGHQRYVLRRRQELSEAKHEE